MWKLSKASKNPALYTLSPPASLAQPRALKSESFRARLFFSSSSSKWETRRTNFTWSIQSALSRARRLTGADEPAHATPFLVERGVQPHGIDREFDARCCESGSRRVFERLFCVTFRECSEEPRDLRLCRWNSRYTSRIGYWKRPSISRKITKCTSIGGAQGALRGRPARLLLRSAKRRRFGLQIETRRTRESSEDPPTSRGSIDQALCLVAF